jgi:hypothetical protein
MLCTGVYRRAPGVIRGFQKRDTLSGLARTLLDLSVLRHSGPRDWPSPRKSMAKTRNSAESRASRLFLPALLVETASMCKHNAAITRSVHVGINQSPSWGEAMDS